jgi:hypothetical protein
MTMDETYTRKQAMELLGIKSLNAFKNLEKKYPEYFVIMKQDPYKFVRYHKATLDRFEKIRDSLKERLY